MQFKIVNVDEVPRRTRNVEPRFFKTPAWQNLQKAIAEDRIPPGKAGMILLSLDELAELGIKDLKAAARPVRKWLGIHYEGKYDVNIKHQGNGACLIIVTNISHLKGTT